MTRKEAREFAMKVFFQMESSRDFNIDNQRAYLGKQDLSTQEEYVETLYSLMCNKKEDIDSLISEFSKKWPVDRMLKTDLAVLRLAICEVMYMDEIPDEVAINEAVELAKLYGEDHSPAYINGILANIKKRKDEEKKES